MKARATINTQKEQADGTCAIRIDVRHNGRYRGAMGISVKPALWDKVRGRVKIAHPRQADWNKAISDRIAVLEGLGPANPHLNAKQLWELALRGTAGRDLIDVLEETFEQSARFTPGTRQVIALALQNAREALPDIRMGELSVAHVQSLRSYLQAQKLGPNTVRVRMRMVRLVYNLACDREGIPHTTAFHRQIPQEVPTMPRNLTAEEVRTIAALDLEGDTALARDAFMLSLYLGGMRFGDLARLTMKDLHDGGVLHRVSKTNDPRWVPVIAPAQAIIDRYHGGGHLIPLLDRWTADSANVTVNAQLKVIAAAAGVKGPLSMHWARHSCTNYLLVLGVPLDVVQMILGHARIQQTIDYAAKFDRKRVTEAMKKVGEAIAGR